MKTPPLKGAIVKCVRPMTSREAEQSGMVEALVIEFTNGIKIYAMRDPEGNGPGCLSGDFKGQQFYVTEE